MKKGLELELEEHVGEEVVLEKINQVTEEYSENMVQIMHEF